MRSRLIFGLSDLIMLLCILVLGVRAQNTSLPVGIVPGGADVTALGAATYNIPIEVAPGTHGVQPNLNVVYNSMTGTGILGSQWDLEGISAITRVGQNIFLDQRSTSASMTYSDRFALDGNRLVCYDPTLYGRPGAFYQPEFEDFSKIYSYGAVGLGPEYFIAYRDDGSVAEYGNTADSKQRVANGIYCWYINKITDINGNYMTFTYGYNGSEVWIDHIDYTGNTAAGLSPYARVSFTYDIYTHIGSSFVAGYEIPQTRLLRAITVQYKNGAEYETVRQYQFSYTEDYPKRLAKIGLMGFDGSVLNPTEVEWTGASYHDDINNTLFSIQSFDGKRGHLAVDFNKDGVCDIIEYNVNFWTPFFKQNGTIVPSGQNYSTTTSWNIKSCIPADIDGDGFSEIVTVCENYNDHRLYVDVTNQAMETTRIIQPFNSSNYRGIVTGDFLGDGKHQIVVMYNNQSGVYIKFVHNTHIISQQIASGVMEVMDFDGDGKMELAISTGQHLTIYKFEPSEESFTVIGVTDINGGFITSGDFNGDGYSDILYQNGNYHIALGNGRTFSYVPTNMGFQHNMSNLQIHPAVIDINNDGYDDIVTFFSVSGGDMKAICYLCCGYYDNKVCFQNPFPASSSSVILTASELTDHYNFTFGDFNNDYHIDLVASKSINSVYDGLLLHEFKMDKRVPQVQKVTAGDGSFVKWIYHDIFGLHYRYASHISILPYQYNVVESMTNSLGTTTQTNTHQYTFRHPTYSFKRQQRMGFLTTSVTDMNLHTTDSLFYGIISGENNNVLQDIIMPVRQKTYVYGQLVKSTGYQPFCLTFDNNLRRYPFIGQTNDTNHLEMTVTKIIELRSPFGRKTADQQTVKNVDDFYPQYTTQTEYHFTTHTFFSGGTITTTDSIIRTSWMNNSATKSVQKQYFTYNNRYLPEQIRVLMDGVTSSQTIQNYDYYGNGTLVTHSGDSCLEKTVTSSFDPTGRFCTHESLGSSFNISRTFSPATGLVLSETDANNLTTSYAYDAFGKLTAIWHPDGNRDTIRYRWYTDTEIPYAKYYTLTSIPGLTYDTERYFDLLGRNICTRHNGYYSDTCYDLKGQIYRISEPYQRGTNDAGKIWHLFQYDQYGRITKESGPYTNISCQYSGYTTTITDNLRQTTSTRTTDAVGRIRTATDEGGTISYQYAHVLYNGKTATQTNITACGHTTSIYSDGSDNRLRIIDPDAGEVVTRYNAQNQPLCQTDARGNRTSWQYDEWGRITKRKISNLSNDSIVWTYEYDSYSPNHRGRGKLSCIKANGVPAEQYIYDNLSRLTYHTRFVDGMDYTESYAYNSYGQLATLAYPDGFATDFTYTGKGYLEEITRHDNGSRVFAVNGYNLIGQPVRCSYGNATATAFEYNNTGLLTHLKAGLKYFEPIGPWHPPIGDFDDVAGGDGMGRPTLSAPSMEFFSVDSTIQNYRYFYDNKGRLSQRMQKNSQYETFQYDNLDRLTSFTQGRVNGTSQTFTTTYDTTGNILGNTLAGTYSYDSDKPHAVTEVTPNDTFPNSISSDNCVTEYNVFNQPSRIREGDVEILLEYGADNQRVKAVFRRSGQVERTRYYINANYEKEVDASGVTTHYNYIYGVNGLAAICVRRNNVDSMYYVYPDRLGSYTHITNANKQLVRNLHFDPWGNVKADTNWTVFAGREPGELAGTFRFDRGFTGHEHYADLNIINMNGRLYDPVIARFFSPDNFVQTPDFTQSYNRYSYCLNNPLQWVDPSGEELFDPWYKDIFGYVQWVDFGKQIPLSGTFLGFEGVFTSGDEMRYYYKDGRVSNNKISQVFIDWDKPADFTFSLSSFPMRGAGFYRIEDPSGQTGSFSSNFQYVAPINPGYINGLNGLSMSIGTQYHLIEYAARSKYKSARSWREFNDLPKSKRMWRYEHSIGQSGKLLKNLSKWAGNSVAAVSMIGEAVDYSFYTATYGFDWKVTTKFGLDMIMTGVGFFGPIGFTVSSIYFILDVSTGGFGGFGEIK